MADDADWQSPNLLTSSEEQLLALIREGRVDAEIAVRLGISNAEVKARTVRLAGKLRVADRSELRDGPAPPKAQPQATDSILTGTAVAWRWKLASAVLAGLVVVLAVMAVTSRLDGTGAPMAQSSGTVGTTLPTITLTPTPTVAPITVSGRKMYDAGQLFVQRSNLITTRPSNREALITVLLGQAAVIRYREGPVRWTISGSGPQMLDFSGQVGPNTVRLFLVAQEGTRFLFGDDDSVGVYSTDGIGPSLIIWAQAPDGPAYYHAELASDGNLHIAAEAVEASAPIAFDTGELLDLSSATKVGDTRLADHWILCDPQRGSSCSSLVRGDFTPSQAGILTCTEESLVFAAQGFSLSFEWSSALPTCGAPMRRVPLGEALGYGGVYMVSASAADGSPLSVVVTRAGEVYVGEVTPKFGCPCRRGN